MTYVRTVFACLAVTIAIAAPTAYSRAQDEMEDPTHVQQVVAEFDGKESVIVRKFILRGHGPQPVEEAPKVKEVPRPKDALSVLPAPEAKEEEMSPLQEVRLRFKAKDIQVMSVDGMPVDATVWHSALRKPKDALMGVYPSATIAAPSGPDRPDVPAGLRSIYKKDTLILYAKSRPIETSAPANVKADGPKDIGLRITLALYQTNGTLHFREPFDYLSLTTMEVLEKVKKAKFVKKAIAVKQRHQGIRSYEIPAQYFRLLDANGKQLPPKRLAQLLAKEKHVLQASIDVDPFYLRLVRPDALIVAPWRPAAGGAKKVKLD